MAPLIRVVMATLTNCGQGWRRHVGSLFRWQQYGELYGEAGIPWRKCVYVLTIHCHYSNRYSLHVLQLNGVQKSVLHTSTDWGCVTHLNNLFSSMRARAIITHRIEGRLGLLLDSGQFTRLFLCGANGMQIIPWISIVTPDQFKGIQFCWHYHWTAFYISRWSRDPSLTSHLGNSLTDYWTKWTRFLAQTP
jgi:hypothetical protein